MQHTISIHAPAPWLIPTSLHFIETMSLVDYERRAELAEKQIGDLESKFAALSAAVTNPK
jgi:hypothetical protein